MKKLVIIDSHPVQYRAPLYRILQKEFNIPITVIYGSDFSIKGYKDSEFNAYIKWDVDLLSGYDSLFLSKAESSTNYGSSSFNSSNFLRILHNLDPGVILLTSYTNMFFRSVIRNIYFSRYKIIFRSETNDIARNRSLAKSIARDLFLRLLYKRCTKLLYIGQVSYRHFRRLKFKDEQLIFSPYGVDASVFNCSETERGCLRSKTRNDLNILEDKVVLLFSGKLVHRKAPDLILDSVQLLPNEIQDRICIIFVGEGKLKEALMAKAKVISGLKDRIHFVGFKNQSELSQYYHAADILVLPSRYWETWGLVVNEALHHGLPCLISNVVGCAPDLIEPGITGEIFESQSKESFCIAFNRILNIVKNAEISERCRLKVSNFALQKSAQGISQAYKLSIGNE
jgi:glycosyltransferase involved in cell wall biosynthesis